MTPRITVVGSVNLDIVARGPRLPRPGETVTGAVLARYPGGKGANQALAARRLGAEVQMVARVGAESAADEALALLREAGVDLAHCVVDPDAATGVALIAVSADGENQIVVAPGANARLAPAQVEGLPPGDALLCQLEVPVPTVVHAAVHTAGFVALNLAPAIDVPVALLEHADLLVVNDTEALHYGEALHRGGGLVVVTHGARGAALIALDGQPARPLRVGAELEGVEGGWRLRSVAPHGALLAAAGGRELRLEMPPLERRSSGSAAAVPSHPAPPVPAGRPGTSRAGPMAPVVPTPPTLPAGMAVSPQPQAFPAPGAAPAQ